MRLDQSSMDISTLVDKIRSGEIDLQPDFQRKQVWSEGKKRRLIDTVLRRWYIPAIHLVVNDDFDKEEVLDGQQRLRAILDFVDGKFAIDGTTEPEDSDILLLHGLRYDHLPNAVKSRFRRFTINTVRLRDYRPEEPGELFFRLNQLTALTAAEQRNALVGTTRNQIRRIANEFEEKTDGFFFGFSNARMNLDDILSRLAVTLESGTLSAKITASTLERRYRTGEPFADTITYSIKRSTDFLASIIVNFGASARLNKASMFSWLFFIIDYRFYDDASSIGRVADFFMKFESARGATYEHDLQEFSSEKRYSYDFRPNSHSALDEVLRLFNDRASSRVNDVTSIQIRDMAMNVAYAIMTSFNAVMQARFSYRYDAINYLISQIEHLPKDVSERVFSEGFLAKQWESHRAEG